MEPPGQCNQLHAISDTNVETIILTLPSPLNVEDQPTNSSLVRSECGQFFLVTYDTSNKIVSKHQINLQINAEEFLEFKCSSTGVNDGSGLTRQTELDVDTSHSLLPLPYQIDDRSQHGTFFQKTLCLMFR